MAHRTLEACLYLLFGQRLAVRRILLTFLFFEELWLKVVAKLFDHCILGITLHARVDGCVDAQAIGSQVIVRSIGLGVLVAPAVERVGLPCQAVFIELLSLP